MTQVLLATDADWLYDEVSAALCSPDTSVARISDSHEIGNVADQLDADLVVLDLQIGSKGGVAACIDLRHDIAMGRLDPTKVIMLLDRDADRWLARQADADGWLIKPLDSFRLRRVAKAVLAGEKVFEGEPVAVANEGAELAEASDAAAS